MSREPLRQRLAQAVAVDRQALLLALLSAAAGWVLGCALLFTPLWQLVEYKLFDVFSVYTAPGTNEMPITIVGIDDATSTQLGLRWPFPRELHAELIDRLVEGGAAVIAFDVQFSEPSTPDSDQRFAEAIANAGNVVLASKYDYYETAGARVFQRMDPVIAFTEAGASVGWTDMDLRGDQVPRFMSLEQHAFCLETIRMLRKIIPDAVPEEPGVPGGAMIRYLGPRDTFLTVPYYQVINRDPELEGVFADAIVLIGRTSGATTEINLAQADSFPTPFTLTTGKLSSGVEIHATQIENAMLGNMLEPATRQQNLLLLTVCMLLTLPWLVYWHPARSSALVLLVVAGAAGAAFWVFREHHTWLAAASPLAGVGLAFVSTGTGSFLTERRRAGKIRGAFAMYVSEDVVKEMIAHPEKLTLGGQRREVSVLFSDLAGFTSLSEKLEPDAVAQVVNMYLNAMTHVIMKNGGTVDKFIGDAVMAFWGAPLDDAEHAQHAVQSSLEMQEAMHAMQPALREYGVEGLHLRIGLNSGPAIIGNMGSDLRFDYTAIGDTVNLASRLEGANKAYGTPILVAEPTMQLVKAQHPMRQVDRVRVKGKEQPVDVYTPCPDASLIALTERAWHAYLSRDWAGARTRIALLREIAPDDRLATMLESRITECEREPPPPGWDGSVGLDKL